MIQTSKIEQTWHTARDDFYLKVKGQSSASTLRYYQSRLTMLIRWAVAENIALNDFSARHLRRYIQGRGEQGISQRTLHHDAIAASKFVAFCAAEEIIEKNPMRNYEKPRVERASVPKPSAQEVRTVLEAIKRRWDTRRSDGARYFSPAARRFYMTRDTAIICTLVATGGRAGEVLGLRLCDVDLDKRQILFKNTKSKVPRTVPVSESCVDVLHAWLKERPAVESDLLFVNNVGEMLRVSGFGRQFVRYVVGTDATRFTLHGLRHFAATEIAKIDLFAAMIILGHKEARTTLIYAHADADHVRQAYDQAAPLDKILVEKRQALARRKRVV